METLLVHSSLLNTPAFQTLTSTLKTQNVSFLTIEVVYTVFVSLCMQVMIHPGPTLASVLPVLSPVAALDQEYGALEVTLEVVESTEEAVEHINTHGSGHTDCIVTEDGEWHTTVCSERSHARSLLHSICCTELPLIRGQCLRFP